MCDVRSRTIRRVSCPDMLVLLSAPVRYTSVVARHFFGIFIWDILWYSLKRVTAKYFVILLVQLNPENEGNTIVRNVGNVPLSDIASHTRKIES
jgi:hypothetical protein